MAAYAVEAATLQYTVPFHAGAAQSDPPVGITPLMTLNGFIK
jgi:hypothetical protein